MFSSISSERVLAFVTSLIPTTLFCSFVGPSACFNLRIAYVCVFLYNSGPEVGTIHLYWNFIFPRVASGENGTLLFVAWRSSQLKGKFAKPRPRLWGTTRCDCLITEMPRATIQRPHEDWVRWVSRLVYQIRYAILPAMYFCWIILYLHLKICSSGTDGGYNLNATCPYMQPSDMRGSFIQFSDNRKSHAFESQTFRPQKTPKLTAQGIMKIWWRHLVNVLFLASISVSQTCSAII